MMNERCSFCRVVKFWASFKTLVVVVLVRCEVKNVVLFFLFGARRGSIIYIYIYGVPGTGLFRAISCHNTTTTKRRYDELLIDEYSIDSSLFYWL